MERIAAIIQNEREWHGPDQGRTMSPRAIDESYDDSLRARQQYGVTFFLCARDWHERHEASGLDGERHTEWYIRRQGKTSIATRINLAGDPPSDKLMSAFGISPEQARKELDQRALVMAAAADRGSV